MGSGACVGVVGVSGNVIGLKAGSAVGGAGKTSKIGGINVKSVVGGMSICMGDTG